MPAGGLGIASIIGLGISGASAVGSLISGGIKESKAKKREQANVRPEYKISDEIYNNVDLASSRAQGGYDQQTLEYLRNMQERGLQSSNSAVLRGGGNVNNVGVNYDNYVQGARSIASEDEKLQMANIQQLMKANESLAEEKAMAWSINDYAPYANEQMAISQLRTQGNSQISNGLNTIASLGMTGAKMLGAPELPKGTSSISPNLDDVYMGETQGMGTTFSDDNPIASSGGGDINRTLNQNLGWGNFQLIK